MSSFLYSVGGFILALGLLVAVHEYGHFWVARRLGVKVLRFSIGFGKPLWSRRSKVDDVEYVVGMIPLGGYVKMLDENEAEVDVTEQHLAFNRQSLWVRSAIAAAGPLANFLFAIVAYWLVFMIGITGLKPIVGNVAPDSLAALSGIEAGDEIVAIDDRPNRTWSEHRLYLFNKAYSGATVPFDIKKADGRIKKVKMDFSQLDAGEIESSIFRRGLGLSSYIPDIPPVVGEVVADSAGARAGLQQNDRIVEIDDTDISSWSDIVNMIRPKPGVLISMVVEREAGRVTLGVTPETVEAGDQKIGRIGIAPQNTEMPADLLTKARFGPVESIWRGAEATWVMSVLTVRMLIKMIRLEVSVKNISGPITIAQYAGQTVQVGIDQFILFLAIISISLGILNLLPIPVLDGGHLLFNLLEAIKGSPLSDNAMILGQQIGIALLAALMGLAFYNDIVRLLS